MELDEVARRQYRTAEYANARLFFEPNGWARWKMQLPVAKDVVPGLPPLLGIPVMLDETLPSNVWRLIDRVTGAVLHEGQVDG